MNTTLRHPLGLATLVVVAALVTGSVRGEPDPSPSPVIRDGIRLHPAAPDDVRSAVEVPATRIALDLPAALDAVYHELLLTREGTDWWLAGRRTANPIRELDALVAKERDPDHLFGASRSRILLTVDGRVAWEPVSRMILGLGFLRLPDVSWAVRLPGAEGPTPLPVPLPHLEEDLARTTWLDEGYEIRLHRRDGGTHVGERGPLDTKRLVTSLKETVAAERLPGVRLVVAPAVPFADVVRALTALRAAGIERVHLPGPAPQGARILRRLPSVPRHGLHTVLAAPSAVRRAIAPPQSAAVAPQRYDGSVHEILVPKDAEVWCGGRRRTPRELKEYLLNCAGTTREERPPFASKIGVTLTVDARVSWRTVQWVLQTAAHPEVRIRRFFWAGRRADGTGGTVPVFLPVRGDGQDPSREVDLSLVPGAVGEPTTPVLTRQSDQKTLWEPRAGEDAFVALAALMPKLRARYPEMTFRLVTAPSEARVEGMGRTSFGDVFRAVAAAVGGGFPPPTMPGTAPPEDDAWR